jgi:hypothetical protein|tara:strand:+ start:2783 stop:3631 length:849 start_codon:yes stop_codon:yes gene_type:complete
MEIVTTEVLKGPITIAPIGDLQLGSSSASKDHFKRHLDFVLKQPNPLFVGMGDSVDVASPSNRQKLRSAALYDSVEEALVDAAERQIEEVKKLLEPTKGMWAGMLEGHHFFEFQDGSTTDTRLCEWLGTPFLGTSAFIQARISSSDVYEVDNSRVTTCTIFCHHGEGSGTRVSAPINKLEGLISAFSADVYLIGHMSKKVAAPVDQLYAKRGGKLGHRTLLLVGTGGFSQGYQEGSKSLAGNPRGSYVEKGMMKPVALGAPIISADYIRGHREDKLDLHVSL